MLAPRNNPKDPPMLPKKNIIYIIFIESKIHFNNCVKFLYICNTYDIHLNF